MKNSLFFTLASLTIALASPAHADFSVPLKANPILCSGVNETNTNSNVSLKLITIDEKGAYSIEYAIDNHAVVKLDSKYPLFLTFEGSLYIQTYDESGKVTLTVANGDIKSLNKDLGGVTLTKLAYALEGRFQAGADAFQVSCLGSFLK